MLPGEYPNQYTQRKRRGSWMMKQPDWGMGTNKISQFDWPSGDTSCTVSKQTHNLAFRYECSSPFHGTAASKEELKANCIASERCLRYYFKLIWESPTTGNTNFHRHLRSFTFKTQNKWPPGWPQSQVFQAYFSTPAIFRATSKLFSLLGCSNDKNWLNFSSIFFKNCRFRSSILASL